MKKMKKEEEEDEEKRIEKKEIKAIRVSVENWTLEMTLDKLIRR